MFGGFYANNGFDGFSGEQRVFEIAVDACRASTARNTCLGLRCPTGDCVLLLLSQWVLKGRREIRCSVQFQGFEQLI